MKRLYCKTDASFIATLPVVEFMGDIIVVESEEDATRAVDALLRENTLGIDTETRPSFRKGVVHNVALLQVATHSVCYLFRLNKIGMSPSIVRLLSATDVVLVGLSLTDDLMRLHQNSDFTPGNFIDLQKEIRKLGVEDQGLRKMYANFFGKKISKRQQLTNWEAPVLSEKQQRYAATDAWACLMLYDEFQRLMKTGDYEIIPLESAEE